MVSAFEVYVVMQLDVVRAALGGLGAALGLGSLIALMGFSMEQNFQWSWDKESRESRLARFAGYIKTAKRTLAGSFAALALSVFLPSSTTAAAMILVPALTSDEVVEPVSREAAELYGLAKKALTTLAEDRSEPAKE